MSTAIRAVMSSVERGGAWTVPSHLEVRALWVELNHQGQFYHWAKARIDLDPARSRLFARSGGMPFSVEEIVDRVLAMKGA